jgi:hypothetical protein
MELFEFEVVISLMRAITKFVAAYHQISRRMQDFDDWCVEKGLRTRRGPSRELENDGQPGGCGGAPSI